MHKLLEQQLAQVFPNGLPREINPLQPYVEQSYKQLDRLQQQLAECQAMLHSKEMSLNVLTDVVADTCIWLDGFNQIRDIRVGKSLARIFSDRLIGEEISAMKLGQSLHLFTSTLDQVRAQNYSSRRELLLKTRTKELYLEARFYPLDESEVMVAIKDITMDKLVSQMNNTALEESQKANKQLQELMNSAPVGILITDEAHQLVMINNYAIERLGQSLTELIGQEPIQFVEESHRGEYLDHIDEQLSQSTPQPGRMDVHLCPDAGDVFAAEMAFNTITLDGRTMVTQVFNDISERKALEQQLREQAQTDPLTGTNNRRAFSEKTQEALEHAKEHKQPFAVLAMDLDYFKRVNDTYGHGTGDMVLSRFVESVSAQLRPCDILGRFGGEEFMLALPDATLEQAGQIAERLRANAEAINVTTAHGILNVTVSIGVAGLNPRHQKLEQILNEADHMLYQSKDQGRNCVTVQRGLPRTQGS
ncbi:diguanylate cyclase [Shewanella submarina]|uniref:diguanylate cyclase n=1 Tax=Shewanella submarina TaxID=2016376 RepID=A0ABV7G929_9GAMM|nr:sensor domain-containing diguanylate cyclase [Shewanella submarina]MCL1038571.1 diguanylate cyclase [Shewanella submarina]